MKKLKLNSLIWFVVVFGMVAGRFWSYQSRILPENWREGEKIRVRARILSQPYQSRSKYIIEVGRIKAIFSTYRRIKVGEWVELVGRPEVRVQMGKITQVYLKNPRIYHLNLKEKKRFSLSDWLVMRMSGWRGKMVKLMASYLPEPEASLAGGILLGVKLGMPDDFYQALVKTGTLHIVAASGFNVTVVLKVVMGLLVGWLGRSWGLLAGFWAVIGYVILAGGSAAVVRAGIMGVLSYGAYYLGRPTEAKRLLWVTALGMVLVQPLMLVDVGFQLSVAATAGILYLEPMIEKKLNKWLRVKKGSLLEKYLAETLYTTLAASIFTVPVILWWFGRVSWISPLVNMLVLGVVPAIMFLSGVVVLVGLVWWPGGWILGWGLYVLLEYMVGVIGWFGVHV